MMTDRELVTLTAAELAQRTEEGCETAAAGALWSQLTADGRQPTRAECDGLWAMLAALPASLEASEPSDLPEIQAQRPARVDLPEANPDQLADRLHGAWLGRLAGCQLGKPVEGWSKAAIDAYLAAAGESELIDYFPYLESAPADLPSRLTLAGCCRGHLAGALRDDDQDYTILGLVLLERHSWQVGSDHVAAAWQELLPFHKTYTAERAAYRNLVNGLGVPECARYRNPYREWIGAQIRCDGWAYACPGQPARAAGLGWRDARVSHIKNGIYGEMLFAAMVAAALVCDDLGQVIAAGLAEIPAECRLAEAVQQVVAWHGELPAWRDCWQRIDQAYGHYHWVHTINNAAAVLLGLLYGNGDLGQTIGIAVHAGWDTDCNGATAGSVLGAMLGRGGIPANWSEPLQDRVESALFGYAQNRISDLASWSHRLAGRLAAEAG